MIAVSINNIIMHKKEAYNPVVPRRLHLYLRLSEKLVGL